MCITKGKAKTEARVRKACITKETARSKDEKKRRQNLKRFLVPHFN